MDCCKADEYFMRYMDGMLSDEDRCVLEEHLHACSGCREDFLIYQQMMTSFEQDDLKNIEAPEGFEKSVMARLEREGAFEKKIPACMVILENIMYILWGVLALSVGAALIFAMNQEQFVNVVSQFTLPQQLSFFFQSAAVWLSNGAAALTYSLGAGMQDGLEFLAGYRYFFLTILVVLFMVQFLIYRKEKVEV